MIERVQGFMPAQMHVVLGDNIQVSFSVSEFIYTQRPLVRGWSSSLPKPSTELLPCAHCSLCRWQERCKAQWEATDHLSLVAGITGSQIAQQHAKFSAYGPRGGPFDEAAIRAAVRSFASGCR